MSVVPLITFKAGQCEIDTDSEPHQVKALAQPGYIYLYAEDALIHFCWRPRTQAIDDEPPLDLVMVPGDGHFVPYTNADQPTSKTNGRIFVLRFISSSTRYLFWLQSKSQSTSGDAAWFSPRDKKIGDVVDRLLQGEEVDVTRELAAVRGGDSRREDDDDDTMEEVGGPGASNDRQHQSASGGAGADATGGDVREEGEDAREGGADGARAASGDVPDAATAVQNFLNSLKGGSGMGNVQQQSQGKVYPLLTDLMEPSTTIPVIDSAADQYLDSLLDLLPPTVLVLALDDQYEGEPTPAAAASAKAAMTLDQKRKLLKQVLRSPQFHQSLSSLSVALRDGGLPSIAEALGIRVENGGLVRGGSVPLGGGDAIEAFVEGVKKTVKEERQ
ncbi:hypothetical protein RB596_007021 [Gaeumannomyces avenae]